METFYRLQQSEVSFLLSSSVDQRSRGSWEVLNLPRTGGTAEVLDRG